MASPLHSVVTERRLDAVVTKPRRRFGRLIGFAMLGTAAIAVPAALAAYPVIDAQNLAQSIQQLSTLTKQLTELKNILSTAEDIFGAVGKAKSAVNAAIPNSYNSVGTQVAAASPNFESWGLPKDLSPNIGSVNKAIETAQKVLGMPKAEEGKERDPITGKKQTEVMRRRINAQQEVMFRALGAAQNAIATSRDASATANNIISAPNADLREQTAQQIQATVGVTQELIQLRVLMATMLELQATEMISGQAVSVTAAHSPSATPEGEDDDNTSPFGSN